MDDLVDSLFRNAEGTAKTRASFTHFLACNDFSVAGSFFRRVVSLWSFWEWSIAERLEDVKRRPPDIEAACEFEPLRGTQGHGLLRRLAMDHCLLRRGDLYSHIAAMALTYLLTKSYFAKSALLPGKMLYSHTQESEVICLGPEK